MDTQRTVRGTSISSRGIREMTKYCPNCGQNRVQIEEKEWDEDVIHFINLIISCQNCGYGWNCVGTKKT